MRGTPKLKDWVALLTLVLFWGTSYALMKIAVTSVSPYWVVAGRLVIAAVILLCVCALMKRKLPRGIFLWACITWLGVAGTMLPFFLISWGTQFIPSAEAGILMAMTPLWVIIMAHFMLDDEKLNRYKIIGFAIGFAGVATLFDIENIMNFPSDRTTFWGQMGVIGGTLCFAIHAISARLMPKVAPLEMSASVVLAGAIVSTIVAIVAAPDGFSDASTSAITSIIALGIFPTALASIVLYFLLASAGASFVSYTNYLLPPYALLLGVVVMSESLAANVYIGLALIMTGIAFSQIRPQHP